ncbi:MAG: DNA polymerase III subunit delta [Gemmatimonadales bacterium]|jgi:DNA polymerase-3 subunit delta
MAASLSFASAFRQIRRGELAPVYYLTGDEDVLKDELMETLADRIVDPATRDFNFDVRTASDLDGESLHALVETPPMLTSNRLVVVKNLEQWRRNARVWKVLERYVEAPSPTTVLVLVHGAGQKPHRSLANRAVHVVLQPLDADRAARWVAHRAERVGIAFTAAAIRHLVDVAGSDLSHLVREIDKLAAAATADTPVDVDDVAQYIGIHRGHTAQDWVAAVIARDFAAARAALRPVLATPGTSAVRLLNAVGTALIGVRLARDLRDGGASDAKTRGTLVSRCKQARLYGLGRWSDVAAVWTTAANAWTDQQLADALRAAQAADKALKSTTLSDDVACLELLLLELDANRWPA